jgi:hypothetical protein
MFEYASFIRYLIHVIRMLRHFIEVILSTNKGVKQPSVLFSHGPNTFGGDREHM